MNICLRIILPLLALSLGGCQSVPPKQAALDSAASLSEASVQLPFDEPEPIAQELDEDLVYSYLVGEIGARSGDLRTSLVHYLHAAILARDAYAAERATRIAIHLKDYEQGLRASRRWIELAPNSLTARQFGGILMLRGGDSDAALEQFRAMVRIADALGKDGLLQVATALNGEPDGAAALRVMRSLVAENGSDAHAHYAMAVLETSQKRYTEAETSLREAIRIRPQWALPRVLLSRVLVALGRAEQGLRHLAGAVEDYPDSRLIRISYARMLVGDRQYEQALQQFRELHRRQPEDHEVRYAYAMLATQQSAWDEARRLWQLLRGQPKHRDEATYFLAQVEETAGNTDLAVGLYRSVGKGEFRVDAVIRSSGLMAENGQLAQAREELAQARITNPDRTEDLYVAETQILQHAESDRGLILSLYETAIGAHPESNDLLYNRGLYYSDIDELDAMEADFRAVLERDRDHAEALNALGYMLADRGVRLDEALAYISRAHKLRPDSAAILDSLGWAYYRKGEYALALEYLRRAVSAGEPDDEIAAHLGEVLWVSGEQEEAQSVWNKALETAPKSEHIRSVIERFLSNP